MKHQLRRSPLQVPFLHLPHPRSRQFAMAECAKPCIIQRRIHAEETFRQLLTITKQPGGRSEQGANTMQEVVTC